MPVLLCLLAQLPLLPAPQTDALTEELQAAGPDARVECLVQLEHLSSSHLTNGRRPLGERLELLRAHAARTQAPLMEWCAAQADAVVLHEAFWLGNVVHLEAPPAALGRLARLPEVRRLSHNGTASALAAVRPAAGGSTSLPWNIERIDAGLGQLPRNRQVAGLRHGAGAGLSGAPDGHKLEPSTAPLPIPGL